MQETTASHARRTQCGGQIETKTRKGMKKSEKRLANSAMMKAWKMTEKTWKRISIRAMRSKQWRQGRGDDEHR